MNALNKQVGGDHYKGVPIQHVEFCQRNQIPWCESAAIKYIIRHKKKNGRQDIEKAIHYLELLLEIEYPQNGPAKVEPVGFGMAAVTTQLDPAKATVKFISRFSSDTPEGLSRLDLEVWQFSFCRKLHMMLTGDGLIKGLRCYKKDSPLTRDELDALFIWAKSVGHEVPTSVAIDYDLV